MKEFGAYIKMHRKSGLLLLLWVGVFLIVFVLSALPVDTILYGLLLWTVIAAIMAALDFYGYRKHVKQLRQAESYLALTLEHLPDTNNMVEGIYQDMLREIFQQRTDLKSEYDSRYSEMMNYYTMWMHQIKTPIAAANLLLESEKEIKKEELKNQMFRIEEYVGMALQYLRMEHMGADLKFQHYPLDQIVRQAVRKYAKSFMYKKIAMDYHELNFEVITDEKWLLFAIEQILSNAIKYTREGKISVYMEPESEGVLVIEDTGIGIAAEDLPRIFEWGFTGYNGRIEKKSTGLGLYLTKTILSRLGHRIWIESEEGKGTKVKCGLASIKLEVE
ncbi:MAG: sensor histidine kinase [Lachnospiraceae bacterium]|nr:sensor histidine kinase [Lachnospiraceae bacterium]